MWSYGNAPVVMRQIRRSHGSVWIVALIERKVKSVEHLSIHSFCAAVDKEIRIERVGIRVTSADFGCSPKSAEANLKEA